ncbi:MAG: AEC family transporter [Desulfobulbaceae bacterium]|uniref:AEC family transporter n=1 Tax=Candidatus Desulfatifera sulfidica TaxID=2841691 RepID=A0A8J6N9C5_9BACT|nr:AEC family transporter [Candidatus Desulfatifera sulfidica]
MENFLLITICLGAGLIIQRFKIFSPQAPLALNQYVIWVALPALILKRVPTLTFSSELLTPIILPWVMVIIGVILVLIAARIMNWSREITGVLLLAVPLGNTSFLGIPMITAFFGEDMLPYGIIYDQFGSFMALSTYGTLILAIYGDNNTQPNWRHVIRKIVTFPPFIALTSALLLGQYLHNQILTDALDKLGSSLVPVVMFAIGLQLKIRMAPGHSLPFTYGLIAKLILAPLIGFGLCRAAGIDTPAATIAIFEAGMPPMVTAGALAISAGMAPGLAAALTGWGILVAFITLPILAYFL